MQTRISVAMLFTPPHECATVFEQAIGGIRNVSRTIIHEFVVSGNKHVAASPFQWFCRKFIFLLLAQ